MHRKSLWLGVSSRISTIGPPAPPPSTARASCGQTASGSIRSLARVRSRRRRVAAGVVLPGATAASRPLWQWRARAMAKLRSARALAWWPWRSGRSSSRTCCRQSRIMGRALMDRLREERGSNSPSCKSMGALPLPPRNSDGPSGGRPRGYVGDLKSNRNVEWKGRLQKVSELAAGIATADRKELRIGDDRQWYFTVTLRIPDVKHKVRIVILWRYRNDEEPCKILVSNRITWEVSRVVRVYRHRWTGTETFHRDGKQQLGWGDCQLRDVQGQTRHMYLVMLAYSLLMIQLRQNCAREWALHRLTTIGEACRAMLRENLRATIAWVIAQVTERERPFDHVIAQLGLG